MSGIDSVQRLYGNMYCNSVGGNMYGLGDWNKYFGKLNGNFEIRIIAICVIYVALIHQNMRRIMLVRNL